MGNGTSRHSMVDLAGEDMNDGAEINTVAVPHRSLRTQLYSRLQRRAASIRRSHSIPSRHAQLTTTDVDADDTAAAFGTFQWTPCGPRVMSSAQHDATTDGSSTSGYRWRNVCSSQSYLTSAFNVPGSNANGSFCRRDVVESLKARLLAPRRFYKHRKQHRQQREHSRIFRDLIARWSTRDLHCLVMEYESSAACRDLSLVADEARPHVATLASDLVALYNAQQGCDVLLEFKGATFPAHRAVLIGRCRFFRDLFARAALAKQLSTSVGGGSTAALNSLPASSTSQFMRVEVSCGPNSPHQCLEHVSPELFGCLLRLLYSGDVGDLLATQSAPSGNAENTRITIEFLLQLKDEFGVYASLDTDMEAMLTNQSTTDLSVEFVRSSSSGAQPVTLPRTKHKGFRRSSRHPGSASTLDRSVGSSFSSSTASSSSEADDSSFSPDSGGGSTVFRCHSVVLAARSAFLRSALSRVSSSGRLVLDESIISRHYAPVLFYAMYTDQLDLTEMKNWRTGRRPPASSLSEVQAIAQGRSLPSPLHEAADLYQIAHFLDFPRLAQLCEDLIVTHLSVETLGSIWQWVCSDGGSVASRGSGSEYVRRRCVRFVVDHFSDLKDVLLELDQSLLEAALRSDFVQASELEVLRSVVCWSEHQLARRLEEREPNVLANTAHSIARRGLKRTDLPSGELREVCAPLMAHLRIDHVLPTHHAFLLSAIADGLVRYPAYMSRPPQPDRGCPPSPAAIDTAKNLSDRIAWLRCDDTVPSSSSKPDFTLPRLYMPYFSEAKTLLARRLSDCNSAERSQLLADHFAGCDIASLLEDDSEESVVDMESLAVEREFCDDKRQELEARVQELLSSSALVRRAVRCGCSYHRREATRLILLRVLRENGLGDECISVLRRLVVRSVCHVNLDLLNDVPSTSSAHCAVVPDDEQLGLQHDDYEETKLLPDLMLGVSTASSPAELTCEEGSPTLCDCHLEFPKSSTLPRNHSHTKH